MSALWARLHFFIFGVYPQYVADERLAREVTPERALADAVAELRMSTAGTPYLACPDLPDVCAEHPMPCRGFVDQHGAQMRRTR